MAGRSGNFWEIHDRCSSFLWPELIGNVRKSAPPQSAHLHADRGQLFKERYKPTERVPPLLLLAALRKTTSKSATIFEQPDWPTRIDEIILACGDFSLGRRCAFGDGSES